MRLFLFMVALSLAALADARAETLVPLPAPLLRDGRLEAAAWNLSLEAPSSDWVWLMASEMGGHGKDRFQSFVCRSPQGEAVFRVGAFEAFHDELTEADASRFVQGSAQGLRNQRFQASVGELGRSSIPVPGSYRFVVDARSPDAGSLRIYGYVAARGRMFVLQHASAGTEEPEPFRKFVSSFRFLGKPADPLEVVSRTHLALACIGTLLIGAVGWSVNSIARRVVVNLWYAAIAGLLAAGVALSARWSLVIPRDVSPFRSGEIWGQVVGGPILLPLAFAAWRAVALRARRRHEQARR